MRNAFAIAAWFASHLLPAVSAGSVEDKADALRVFFEQVPFYS